LLLLNIYSYSVSLLLKQGIVFQQVQDGSGDFVVYLLVHLVFHVDENTFQSVPDFFYNIAHRIGMEFAVLMSLGYC
jgi:hypothetical protein